MRKNFRLIFLSITAIIIILALLASLSIFPLIGKIVFITAHVLSLPSEEAPPPTEGTTTLVTKEAPPPTEEGYIPSEETFEDFFIKGQETIISAEQKFEEGNIEGAIDLYKEVLDSFSETIPGVTSEEAAEIQTLINKIIDQTETLIEEGFVEEATIILVKVTESAEAFIGIGELGEASQTLSKVVEQNLTLIEQGNLTEAETLLNAIQESEKLLVDATSSLANQITENLEEFDVFLGLEELNLTAEDFLTTQQNQTQIKNLLIQVGTETDERIKKDLLIQVQQLQKESLETMPEIEKVIEISDTVETTSQSLQKASEQATAPKALTLLGRIVASESKALSGITIERDLTAYQITNREQTDAIVERTKVELKFEASEDMEDVVVVEIIPKKVASNASQLIFPGQQPTILQADPIVSWRFDEVKEGETKIVSYIVKKKIEKIESITLMGKNIFIEEKPLFDVSVSIIDESKQVFLGEDVIAEIQLIKMRGAKVDVDVYYSIKDTEENIIATKHEMVAVETKAIFVGRLFVPPSAKLGKYSFYVKVVHEEGIWEASDSFEVIGKLPKGIDAMTATILGALGIVFFVFILVLYYMYHQTKKLTGLMEKITEDHLIGEGLIKRR